MRVCSESGCGKLIPAAGYCDTHRRARDQARGTRQQRGYDRTHDQERARWQRRLDIGEQVFCHNPDCKTPRVPIDPKHWDLGHTPDRTAWRGPEHPYDNRAEGGRAAHR
jgi:hypothetical protein